MKEHLVDLNVSKVFCIAELLQQQKTKGNTTYRISKPLYAVFMRYEISTICLYKLKVQLNAPHHGVANRADSI